jgi:hypothetical protein
MSYQPTDSPRTVLDHFPQEAELLGKLIIEYNVIEFAIVSMLAFALKDKAAIAYKMAYALQNNRARLDSITAALAVLVKDEDKTQLAAIIDETQEVLHARNKYTHGFYVRGKRETLRRVVMHEDFSTQKALVPVTEKELELALDRTLRLRRDIIAFRDAAFPGAALQALASTPSESEAPLP